MTTVPLLTKKGVPMPVLCGEEPVIVPRPIVVLIVIVLTLLLAADVLAQFVIPGHTASPVIDGAILTGLAGVVAASRGPKPPAPQPSPTPGRHRGQDEEV